MNRWAPVVTMLVVAACSGAGAGSTTDTGTETGTTTSPTATATGSTETSLTTATAGRTTGAGTSGTGTTGGSGGDPDPVPPELATCDGGPTGRSVAADPSTYKALLPTLAPGDRMELAAGDYPDGLPITDLHGEPGQCLFIEGPARGPGARFVGSSTRNTVSIRDSSYVVIRNLELDGAGELGDAVKAEGDATFSHHIVLEGLHIHDHDATQQVVGISTKSPAAYWVIRGNRIETTGTGLYLGNSNGEAPFVAGLIERNLITSTLGYNAQIKHQNPRPALDGLPTTAQVTIIRHNVLSKEENANDGNLARPNLLLGHWPLSGPGQNDAYLVYGNFLFENAVDALMQAEGNVHVYQNILVNPVGSALHIQPHNDVPKDVSVFSNTVVAAQNGVRISGADPGFDQLVIGNLVFAANPVEGGNLIDNLQGPLADAPTFLEAPTAAPGQGLSVDPLPAAETPVNPVKIPPVMSWDRDFEGRPRDHTWAGAYSGPSEGGWELAIDFKP